MNTTIVIRLTAMGDVLLAVPAVKALEADGNSVHWVLHSRWRQLAPLLPAERIHLFGGLADLPLLAKGLRKLSPQKVVDLQVKPLSVVLSALIGTSVRRYHKRSLYEHLAAALKKYPIRPIDTTPVWLKYAAAAGVKADANDALINLKDDTRRNAAENFLLEAGLEPNNFVLLHATAAHAGKRIPIDGIEKFVEISRHCIALFGDDRENYALKNTHNLVDLRNRIDLYMLPYIMSHAMGVISTDSGPMHLARAVGVPVVGIYLQTDPILGFAPIPSPDVKIFSKRLPCKPCSLHGDRSICPAQDKWACKKLDWARLVASALSFIDGRRL